MTTSPLTEPEIERAFGDLAPPPAPASAREEWRRYAGFLKRPRLPSAGTETGSYPAIGRLLALDLALMMLFFATLSAAQAFGFTLPDNVNNALTPDLATLALIVLAAPIGEELIFRSWLRGHPGVMAATACVVLGFALLTIGALYPEGSSIALALGLAGALAALIGAPLGAFLLLKRPVPAFFANHFPVFFWLSTAAFALIHLANYTEGSLPILLLLVLPQFLLGTMLGYLRVHYSLVAAIVLHAVHNAVLFGLAVLGGLGETAPAA
ncbi:MAG: CPBP family glutamic-type intramembrane protease [Erythrobacter sp.]|uniref:CPBP family glutamic-type intramembrane protease n=1 Tax=Erythrobacter sp. TaxID=1042 RepID=UPI00261689D3|nr:CPBP family glutamic-type intramembrane protease [Erythrobacter sp.]MDJ0979402.1 CPBP family glutamic-type intramembrane protease [Erythrobacter sp.]